MDVTHSRAYTLQLRVIAAWVAPDTTGHFLLSAFSGGAPGHKFPGEGASVTAFGSANASSNIGRAAWTSDDMATVQLHRPFETGGQAAVVMRYLLGGTPWYFLKARLKAASDWYPTSDATTPSGSLPPSTRRAAKVMRQAVR